MMSDIVYLPGFVRKIAIGVSNFDGDFAFLVSGKHKDRRMPDPYVAGTTAAWVFGNGLKVKAIRKAPMPIPQAPI